MTDKALPDFRERAPWLGPDLQTIRNMLRPPPPELAGGERLLLSLPDGDRLAARLDRPPGGSGRPLVVLIHGLTGTEASVNVLRTARRLVAEGWPVLRLNLRGSAVSRPFCRGRYHAGRTEDLAAALRQLPAALTARGVALVGHSLGGNLVLKFMGEGAHEIVSHGAPVLGAVAVSTPLDLAASSRRIQARRNLVYHLYLLRGLKEEALGPGATMTASQRDAIASARSIHDFDDRFVAPAFGYRDAEEYYAQNSAGRLLPGVRRPTLIIHAMNDPWVPAASYTAIDWSALPNIDTAFAAGGGHLGFHGRGSRIGWHDLVTGAWLAEKFSGG